MRTAFALVMLGFLLPSTASAQVVINEFLPNPASTDTGNEWIELYNPTGAAINIDGWAIQRDLSDGFYTNTYVLPTAGFEVPPGGYFVIGESAVAGADHISPGGDLNLGNDTGGQGDGVRLIDDGGVTMDTVVYGASNGDEILDDSDAIATSWAVMPASAMTLARSPNGADTGQSGVDFIETTPTFKAENPAPPSCVDDPGTITINEIMPNPAGNEGQGLEWVELYNSHPTNSVVIEGWEIHYASKNDEYGFEAELELGATIGPLGFFVLGEPNVVGADQNTAANMSFGGGSNGDGIRLYDCNDARVDTVVYGTASNTDNTWDDNGARATSLAPSPGDGESLVRAPDGDDTDDNGADFELHDGSTMGAANPTPAPCDADPGTITLNELMPNPAGGDTGFEWVELYNSDPSVAFSLAGWELQKASTNDEYTRVAEFGPTATIGAQGFFVLGETDVIGADENSTTTWSLGSGLRGDGIRLVDCNGYRVDTVAFGDQDNVDEVWDDNLGIASTLAPKPGDGDSLARVEDGVDSDDCAFDFFLSDGSTMGLANPEAPVCVADDGTVKINEFLSNPLGSDGEALGEWVELYNSGSGTADLDGWEIEVRTSGSSGWSGKVLFPALTQIAASDLLLIGETNVAGADLTLAEDGTLSMGTGSGGDGVRLLDCTGAVADSVVYGDPANEDGIEDDSGVAAISVADAPSEGSSLARKENGVDTDASKADFTVSSEPTPGTDNPLFECFASNGDITINEFLPDPGGTDSEMATEFIELYNSGTSSFRLDGWYLVAAGQPDDLNIDVMAPPQTSIASEGFFVIGLANVPEADFVAPFSIGNGSSGDGMYLYDCTDTLIDAVVYGSNNDDMLEDEDGMVAEPAANPSSDQALARKDDGVDTNDRTDWFVDGTPTPGATNFQEIPDVDPDDEGGCGRNNAPPGGDAPSGCGAGEPTENGCNTLPLPFGGFELLMIPLVVLRRRR